MKAIATAVTLLLVAGCTERQDATDTADNAMADADANAEAAGNGVMASEAATEAQADEAADAAYDQALDASEPGSDDTSLGASGDDGVSEPPPDEPPL